MTSCPACNSERIKKKGTRNSRQRFKCKDCHHWFSGILNVEEILDEVRDTIDEIQEIVEEKASKIKMIEPYLDFRKEHPNSRGIVVTSAINNTGLNKEFFSALQKYCESKNFTLMVIPLKYMNPSAMNMGDDPSWPPEVQEYLMRRTYTINGVLKVIGDCNIQATATHPLTGIDGLTDGMTTIVGHPIVQMKTLPVNPWRDPIIMHSTGSVSLKNNYSASKAGYRASYHHCFSAVVVEMDGDIFHIRQLMADRTGGFFDLCDYYGPNGYERTERAEAIVLGDEHVAVQSGPAYMASFYGKNSMLNVLKPKFLVRHDVFDAQSCGKHDVKNFFGRFKKFHQKTSSVTEELDLTLSHLEDTTPEDCISLIANANHTQHLDQWLNEYGDPKYDLLNAELYHNLMYRKLKDIREGNTRDSFRIYAEDVYGVSDRISFMDEGFELHGVQLSLHGDRGPSGARGSIQNLSRIGERVVIGHSHQPGILGGAWQTGTLSRLDLDYAKGSPSAWLHTNCVIYSSGKRQLVNIVRGKWRP